MLTGENSVNIRLLRDVSISSPPPLFYPTDFNIFVSFRATLSSALLKIGTCSLVDGNREKMCRMSVSSLQMNFTSLEVKMG